MSAYLGLFAAAFVAATVLPAYSEVMLAGLLLEGFEPLALWAWASAGNTLGSVLNWALARFFLRYQDRRWFPFRANRLSRAQAWFQRYGVWSLLMAWAPVGGDALTFVAGLMKVRFRVFLPLVAIGKAGRYAVVIAMIEGTGGW